MSDYRVSIGYRDCNVSFLSDNLLTCRPPHDEPKPSHDDPFCAEYNAVLVRNMAVDYDSSRK